MAEEVFVTEVTGLHTTLIRGIHEMTIEGSMVRIFCFDRKRHPTGIEHQVNADLLMTRDDLMTMLRQVYEFAMTGPQASLHQEFLIGLREKRH